MNLSTSLVYHRLAASLKMKMSFLQFIIIFYIFVGLAIADFKEVTIQTREGNVRGHTVYSDSPVYHFYGIPYAKPPIGECVICTAGCFFCH